MKPVALYAKMDVEQHRSRQRDLRAVRGVGDDVITAEQLGRRCIGIELDPRYVDVVVNRWEALTGRRAAQGAGGDATAST